MSRRTTTSRLRARQQSAKAGEEIRAARVSHGMTRQQVAQRAGVSWATEAQVELGAAGVRLDTLCAVGEAVGLDVVLRAYPGMAPSLRDVGQLRQAELLVSLASAAWHPELEVAVGERRQAIDVAFFGAEEIQAHEIERLATDFQDQFRRADAKRRLLAGQHRRPVRLILVVEDTPRNRSAVEAHRSLVDIALPATSREILASLRSGEPLRRDGLLWFRTRRFAADGTHRGRR